MDRSSRNKSTNRTRKTTAFTISNQAKSELMRLKKLSSVPMSRILDARILREDRLSPDVEAFLLAYCERNGVSREEALSRALLAFRSAQDRPSR